VNARYTVATLDYVYTNGTEDGFTLFAPATRPPKVHTDREADFRATTERSIRDRKTVTNTIEGRIVREGPEER
jgi:hypothetical protein